MNCRSCSALRHLAIIVRARDRTAEGLALLDSAVALSNESPDSVTSGGYMMAQRVPSLLRLGRLDEAARSPAVGERRLGTSPTVTATHRSDVQRYAGIPLLARGDAAGALTRLRAAASLSRSRYLSEPSAALNACLTGVSLAALGRPAEARPLLGTACTAYESRGLPDPLLVEWIARARRNTSHPVPRENSQ